MIPCLILLLLVFFLVCENMCNIFAEITYFGDREFYKVFLIYPVKFLILIFRKLKSGLVEFHNI